MPQHFLLLQASSKSRLDSSFQSLEKITPSSWLSFENPLLFSLVLIVIIVAVTFIYFRYVIIPMKKKHLQEQENIRLQQAELMALFSELSPDPIFRFDLSGKIVLANNSVKKIFTQKILVGEKVETLLPFIKTFDIKDLIHHGKTVNYTTLINERYFQFLLSGVPKFNVCQVYGRDITDIKAKEKELKSALAKAEEAKVLKEQFLAQISHEIRSPLNVIVGYSDLLKNELQENFKEYDDILRSIKNNSKRLYRTFDLMINMSQLQTSKYETRFESVDISSILKTAYREFLSLAEEKRIELNLLIKTESVPMVLADHYSMTQIFFNLIDNAIKYTDYGKVDLIIYHDGSYLCVDIKDTGMGISDNYLQKLFTPFTQENMGYSRSFEGTGLGLALVKGFIELNKAKIKVNSEHGKGTTFTVMLTGDSKWSFQK